jgi:hypothetical protein
LIEILGTVDVDPEKFHAPESGGRRRLRDQEIFPGMRGREAVHAEQAVEEEVRERRGALPRKDHCGSAVDTARPSQFAADLLGQARIERRISRGERLQLLEGERGARTGLGAEEGDFVGLEFRGDGPGDKTPGLNDPVRIPCHASASRI